MKIAAISSDSHRLHEIGSVLNAYHVALIEGGISNLRATVETESPDLILLDVPSGDSGELTLIEHVIASFPRMAVVLLCPAPSQEFLLHAMRAGIREVLPLPVAPVALEDAVRRIAMKLAGGRADKAGKILAFMSCKGGSGATFLATNLGYQLAARNSVLLLDLNLQFGDALSFLHDDKPVTTLADLARDIARLDASLLTASSVKITPNYFILAAPEDPAQAPEISAAQVEAILALAVTQYDFVLIDMARTLDTLSIKTLDRADRIYPILQPGLPYLRSAVKLLAAFQGLGYASDKVQWIVNRNENGSEIGLGDIRRLLGTDKLCVIGNAADEVRSALDLGRPLAELARNNPVTKNLTDLMRSIDPRPEVRRGFLDRLRGRS